MELLPFKITPDEAKFFKFVIRQINYKKSTLIKTTRCYSARMSQTKVVLITYFSKSLLKIAKIYIKKNDDLSIGDCISCYHKWLSKGILKTDFKFKNNFYFEIEANVNNCYYDIIPHRVIKKLEIDPVFYPFHNQFRCIKKLNKVEKQFFIALIESAYLPKTSINDDEIIIVVNYGMRQFIDQYLCYKNKISLSKNLPSRNYLRKLVHKWDREGGILWFLDNDRLTFKLSYTNPEHKKYIDEIPINIKKYLDI